MVRGETARGGAPRGAPSRGAARAAARPDKDTSPRARPRAGALRRRLGKGHGMATRHEPEESGGGAAKVDITRPDGTHILVEGSAAFVARKVADILTALYPPPPPLPPPA